ncbi:DNA-directed RNA polymerase subunit beta [Bienertia sinuspersici]
MANMAIYCCKVCPVDAKGNTALVSGTILPIDVWSTNGVKYFVEFNDLCQPIRKGGHVLIRFIGMMAKMETHCPVREEDWHAIDSHIKGKIVTDIRDRFVIPDGAEYDKQALKRANKAWRQYRFSLKKEYYKPKEKTLDEMCSQVPPSGISSNNWIKLVKYWHSDKGKNLSECGKKARAFLNQYHRSGSNSFANQQADYEDEHGEKMSLLALWIKSHMGKDGSFLSGTDTNDFVDDVNAKVEQLRLKYPTKSQLELENEAFEEIMYQDEIPDRPVGYGLGVKKGDIYGVRGVLRKEGYGKIQRNIVLDSFKEEMVALHKKNDKLEKEKEKLKDQVQQNNFLFKTLIGQFSQVVSAVRQEKSSPELLNCTQELLGMAHQQVGKGTLKAQQDKKE